MGLVQLSWAVLLVDSVCSGSDIKDTATDLVLPMSNSSLHQGPLCPQLWPYPSPALGSPVRRGDTFCSLSPGTPGEVLALGQPSPRGWVCVFPLGQAAWLCATGTGWPCWESLTASLVMSGHPCCAPTSLGFLCPLSPE